MPDAKDDDIAIVDAVSCEMTRPAAASICSKIDCSGCVTSFA
jgi:hypothetical protein